MAGRGCRGCVRGVEQHVRLGFNKVYNVFRNAGVNVWGDYRTRESSDNTLLLEYKPH